MFEAAARWETNDNGRALPVGERNVQARTEPYEPTAGIGLCELGCFEWTGPSKGLVSRSGVGGGVKGL